MVYQDSVWPLSHPDSHGELHNQFQCTNTNSRRPKCHNDDRYPEFLYRPYFRYTIAFPNTRDQSSPLPHLTGVKQAPQQPWPTQLIPNISTTRRRSPKYMIALVTILFAEKTLEYPPFSAATHFH